jgi:hypothetical protein
MTEGEFRLNNSPRECCRCELNLKEQGKIIFHFSIKSFHLFIIIIIIRARRLFIIREGFYNLKGMHLLYKAPVPLSIASNKRYNVNLQCKDFLFINNNIIFIKSYQIIS